MCSCPIVSSNHYSPPPLALTFLYLFLCSASQGVAGMIVGGTLQGTDIKHGVNIYKGRKRIMEKIVLINWETGVHGKGGNMGRDKSKDFLNRVI